MKSNKLIRWLIAAVVLMMIVLAGLWGYFKYTTQKRLEEAAFYEKEIEVAAGTPKITVQDVSYKNTNSWRGIYRKVDGNVLETSVESGGQSTVIKWSLTPETTVTCTDDLYTNNDGKVFRRSEMVMYYKDGEVYNPEPMANDVTWLKNNAINGNAVQVFGDLSTMTAKVIFLYKDKCAQ